MRFEKISVCDYSSFPFTPKPPPSFISISNMIHCQCDSCGSIMDGETPNSGKSNPDWDHFFPQNRQFLTIFSPQITKVHRCGSKSNQSSPGLNSQHIPKLPHPLVPVGGQRDQSDNRAITKSTPSWPPPHSYRP